MVRQARFGPLLQGRPLTGWDALNLGIGAVVVPTVLRGALNGLIMGCEFTPYLPFVLLAALLLRWWQAGAVALASVAAMAVLFVAPAEGQFFSACFQSSAGLFLVASATLIGAAALLRPALARIHRTTVDETAGGIVFSLEKEQVWASWYGSPTPVRLGSQEHVEARMEDFLAQSELGKRLTEKAKGSRVPAG